MSRVGGDLPQLSSLKQTFDRSQQNIQELTSSLSNAVDSAWWIGPAAERFKAEWEGTHRSNLQNLAQALQECSREVESRRQQLEAAGT